MNPVGNTLSGILSTLVLASGGYDAPSETKPAVSPKATANQKPDSFVQADTKALAQADAKPAAAVKNENTNKINDELDPRGKLFEKTDLHKALTEEIKVPISEAGFPEWTKESLTQLIKTVEANSSGIAAGFGGLVLSKTDDKGNPQTPPKFTHAISFGKGSPKETEGSTFLITDSKELHFAKPDGSYAGAIKEPLVRGYFYRYKDPQNKVINSPQIRMNDLGSLKLNDGAKIGENGRVSGGTAELTIGFIGGNPKTIQKVTIDPRAKESTVSEGTVDKQANTTTIKITVPASSVLIAQP